MSTQTAFRSEERFDQRQFRRWLDARPSSDINHYELLNGRIVMAPPAGWPHGRIEVKLASALHQHVAGRELGVVLGSSTGFDLPSGDTVEPDVSFISSERLAAGPAPERRKFLRVVPNLAVEILSDPTARRDREEKRAIYERNGVDEYWIVDPDHRQIILFALGKRGYRAGHTVTRGRLRSRVLPDLEISVEEILTL
jgi:Uma2 family endonuclease